MVNLDTNHIWISLVYLQSSKMVNLDTNHIWVVLPAEFKNSQLGPESYMVNIPEKNLKNPANKQFQLFHCSTITSRLTQIKHYFNKLLCYSVLNTTLQLEIIKKLHFFFFCYNLIHSIASQIFFSFFFFPCAWSFKILNTQWNNTTKAIHNLNNAFFFSHKISCIVSKPSNPISKSAPRPFY